METTISWITFIIFALMTLAPAVMVVQTKNLFHGALYLLLSLFGVAGLYVLLIAPFLAAIQVLVYMGAIGILIIFAVMLTRGVMTLSNGVNSQQAMAALVAAFLFLILALVLTPLADSVGLDDMNAEASIIENDDPADPEYETIAEIGRVIADRNGFVLPFEVASMLLTAAMIGAIVVAREDEA
jgi:NADH-quinone oxidoreductase subunit J